MEFETSSKLSIFPSDQMKNFQNYPAENVSSEMENNKVLERAFIRK